ncbi:MAG TPA: LysR family transcriptional regulator [Solirubrobacteraceae bacterium]|nr:LysR family transcriptional regulator [Solirubrobacteraceae bacterium]
MTELDLRHLRYFVAVANEGQMTRAAQRLQLAQPALSQAIARLETQVGVKLLERHPRGVTVTRAGAAFLEKVEATLEAVEDASATARSWASQQEGRLRAGFVSMTPPMLADDLFPRFSAAYPGVTIEWRELGYPRKNARAWLGDADLALIWFAPSIPGLASQRIRSTPRVVAMAESHRLAGRSELRVHDVLDEPFPGIVGCDPGWLGNWGLDAYRGAPARRTDDRAKTPEEVSWIVASGRAITTLPEIVAVPYHHLGIRAIPLIDAEPAVLELVWPEGAATPLVEELVELARQGAEAH